MLAHLLRASSGAGRCRHDGIEMMAERNTICRMSVVADEPIKSGVLGGEGNSAGPEAIKLKTNWFRSEDD